MRAYDDPPDHDPAPGCCSLCECHESRHTEPGGVCAACDCAGFRGERSPDYAERDTEVVDGPCEYERLGARE